MGAIGIGGIFGLGALYLWLVGFWFGGVLAFFPIAWIAQMSLADPHDSQYVIGGRLIACGVIAAIPHFAWGR
jgi:hypothetical protein